MLNKIFAGGLFVLGLTGLFVSMLGEMTTLGDYKSVPPRSWEQFDLQLVKETLDLASLQNKLHFLTNQPTNQPTNHRTRKNVDFL